MFVLGIKTMYVSRALYYGYHFPEMWQAHSNLIEPVGNLSLLEHEGGAYLCCLVFSHDHHASLCARLPLPWTLVAMVSNLAIRAGAITYGVNAMTLGRGTRVLHHLQILLTQSYCRSSARY